MTGELERFNTIKAKIADLTGRKIRLEERHKTEKERLEKLLKEVSDKGYDPKNISEVRKAKETELIRLLEELETRTKDVETKLSAIEGT